MPTRYWIGVVSHNHVQRGAAGGFAQVCHGKGAPLRRMSPGDVLIYYSPKTDRNGGAPLQAFTAVGVVQPEAPYQVEMTPDFHPFRVNVRFDSQAQTASIHPMLPQLSFVKDPKKWGISFRRGLFEIPPGDFDVIATAMGAELDRAS